MSGPFDFTERLVNLSPVDLASLMRRAFQLEAARLELRYGSTNASQRVTVPDEGEDAVFLHVPNGLDTRLPLGDTLFQFKTNADKGKVESLVVKELKESPRPMEMLRAGGSYVVVWPKDGVGRERDDLQKAIREAVGKEFEDRVHVWSVGTLEEILTANPAVLIEFNMVGGMQVLTFDQWAPAARQSIPTYVPDEERLEKIAQLQRLLTEETDTVISHIQGDAGVGKTRLVLEALDLDGVREQVIYGTPDRVGSFIKYVISLPNASCVLFVDDIDPTQLEGLRRSIEPAQGRIRLITAGLPGGYRAARLSGNDIELAGLSGDALVSLVKDQIGLPEASARWFADLSNGYPRLAIAVAGLIKSDPDAFTIGGAIADQEVQLLLDKMLPDDELQELLGIVALFSSIGADGDREGELDAVAAAFHLDRAVLRQTLSEEEGRFVSRAGNLRSITPKLVAVRLASKVLRSRGLELASIIRGLPDPLPARFRDQLVYLREAPLIRQVVDELLKRPEFQDPAAFDRAAAGFLRAAAAANPEQVADVFGGLFAAIDDEVLRSADFPRRDTIWGLEQLLWPEGTYDLAVDLLLRLAENETESFANNATGVLTDSFQILLGGTEASYDRRLAWLDSKLDESSTPSRIAILAGCLASGLRGHQVRTHGSRPDETGARDWRPKTWDEQVAVRQGAWERLASLVQASEGELRAVLFPKLAQAVRETLDGGLADVVLATLLDGSWSPEERAEFTTSLRGVLKFDEPDEEWRASIEEAIERLSGESFAERVRVLFRSRLWDLHEGKDWKRTPPIVEELASEASSDSANLGEAFEATEELDDRNTAYSFWMAVARSLGHRRLVLAAKERPRIALTAYQAALAVGQGEDSAWVDDELKESLADRGRAPSGVQLIQSVGMDDARAELLLEAVAEGRTPPEGLSQLLYGGSVRRLRPDLGVRVIETAADTGTPVALEHALGMLFQYADSDESFLADPAHQELATTLSMAALSISGGTNMRYHYAYELAAMLPIESGLRILKARFENQQTLVEPAEVELLDRAFEESPDISSAWTREILVEATAQPYPSWPIWIEEFHLLSRLARAAGPRETWEWFRSQGETSQIRLMRHLDFGRQKPDEFLKVLLSEADDETILNEASAAFFNSLGTVSGPYYLGLQRQLDRLQVWRAEMPPKGQAWVDELISSYSRQIPEQRRREEEEDALFF